MNPGREAIKYKHEMTDDVTGQGFAVEYKSVNTNNLSLLEYYHGSGTADMADVLNSEQKTTGGSYRVLDYDGTMKTVEKGANSIVTYTRQYDNIQSPTTFAYGTGWYAANPIHYNSLIKDKTVAKSYQEAASMHRQVEYAHALKGDIAVDINCTGPTDKADGKGILSMRIDDDITQGTLHIGELLLSPKVSPKETSKAKTKPNTFDPIIEVQNDYIGDFHVQKTMKLEITKGKESSQVDWLPCCMGGFFDLPSFNFDAQYASWKGIFDCTCREKSISTMKPEWNTTKAQFPTEEYRYKP
ncbi:MAG: hypothetical protein ACOX84_05435 [Methanothrix sp.]|jgi:hypothetical protein|uniref:hypothetical protein n=1 Tax=Methanothrix sp. TaxID=90426 RepID=UPI001BD54268